MINAPILLSTCLSAAFLSAPTPAQSNSGDPGGQWDFTREMQGEYGEIGFGLAMAMNGDMNQDGIDDILITTPGKANGAGGVYLYDGDLRTKIWLINGEFAGDRFGKEIVSMGDTDGDGYSEFVASAPGYDPGGNSYAGAVYIFDGENPSNYTMIYGEAPWDNFGVSLMRIPDMNGDGFDELAVGADMADGPVHVDGGRVYIFDGITSNELMRIEGPEAESRFGSSIAVIGDVDSDGVDDLVIGAKGTDVGVDLDVGRAWVYSGATGSPILFVTGESAAGFFGSNVCETGDVNNDGVPNFMVAAQEHTEPLIGAECGGVYMYDGLTGSLLRRWVGEDEGDKFGGSIAGNLDVNADGVNDVIVGAHVKDLSGVPDTVAGAVYVYSGRGNDLLLRFTGGGTRERLGAELEILGDTDGDGYGEFFVASPEWRPSQTEPRYGRINQLEYDSYMTADNREISASTGGIINFAIDFPDAAASQNYVILFSLGKGPFYANNVGIPLSPGTLFWRTVGGDYNFLSSHTGMTGILDAAGQAAANITQTNLPPSTVGMEAYCAAVTVDGTQAVTHSSGRTTLFVLP